jgi:hypothetical protein
LDSEVEEVVAVGEWVEELVVVATDVEVKGKRLIKMMINLFPVS